jgi:hypothetical protein
MSQFSTNATGISRVSIDVAILDSPTVDDDSLPSASTQNAAAPATVIFQQEAY